MNQVAVMLTGLPFGHTAMITLFKYNKKNRMSPPSLVFYDYDTF